MDGTETTNPDSKIVLDEKDAVLVFKVDNTLKSFFPSLEEGENLAPSGITALILSTLINNNDPDLTQLIIEKGGAMFGEKNDKD